jgi:hypothetical protein
MVVLLAYASKDLQNDKEILQESIEQKKALKYSD